MPVLHFAAVRITHLSRPGRALLQGLPLDEGVEHLAEGMERRPVAVRMRAEEVVTPSDVLGHVVAEEHDARRAHPRRAHRPVDGRRRVQDQPVLRRRTRAPPEPAVVDRQQVVRGVRCQRVVVLRPVALGDVSGISVDWLVARVRGRRVPGDEERRGAYTR